MRTRSLAGILRTVVLGCQAGPSNEVREETGLHYSLTPRGGTDVAQRMATTSAGRTKRTSPPTCERFLNDELTNDGTNRPVYQQPKAHVR